MNSALDELDTAMTDAVSIDVSGNTNVTPATATMLLSFSFTLTGTLTGSIELHVPAKKKLFRFVHNASDPSIGDYTVLVKTASGTGVTLQPGQARLLYCDGVNVALAIY